MRYVLALLLLLVPSIAMASQYIEPTDVIYNSDWWGSQYCSTYLEDCVNDRVDKYTDYINAPEDSAPSGGYLILFDGDEAYTGDDPTVVKMSVYAKEFRGEAVLKGGFCGDFGVGGAYTCELAFDFTDLTTSSAWYGATYYENPVTEEDWTAEEIDTIRFHLYAAPEPGEPDGGYTIVYYVALEVTD